MWRRESGQGTPPNVFRLFFCVHVFLGGGDRAQFSILVVWSLLYDNLVTSVWMYVS
jgi:hypothetical protein